MAVFCSRDVAEIDRFVRCLIERGYTRMPAVHTLQQLRYREFRVYESRDSIRVSYQESGRCNGYDYPEPKLAPPRTVRRGEPCVATPGCDRKSRRRGACERCLSRLYRMQDPERFAAKCRASKARRAARIGQSAAPKDTA